MYIHVHIKVKQKIELVRQISETKYSVSVKEEAKQNKANQKMIELLRDYFDKQNVKIISGHHSPSKLVTVD